MIRIISVGKIKEKYLVDGINEYLKRLNRFDKVEIIEIKDQIINDNPSDKEIEIIKNKEGEEILSKIKDDFVIALSPDGDILDSISFSKMIEESYNKSSKVTFLIGGSLGLSNECKKRANKLISFSKLTFPHMLFRLMLLEQIYRGFKIMNNETYHK